MEKQRLHPRFDMIVDRYNSVGRADIKIDKGYELNGDVYDAALADLSTAFGQLLKKGFDFAVDGEMGDEAEFHAFDVEKGVDGGTEKEDLVFKVAMCRSGHSLNFDLYAMGKEGSSGTDQLRTYSKVFAYLDMRDRTLRVDLNSCSYSMKEFAIHLFDVVFQTWSTLVEESFYIEVSTSRLDEMVILADYGFMMKRGEDDAYLDRVFEAAEEFELGSSFRVHDLLERREVEMLFMNDIHPWEVDSCDSYEFGVLGDVRKKVADRCGTVLGDLLTLSQFPSVVGRNSDADDDNSEEEDS